MCISRWAMPEHVMGNHLPSKVVAGRHRNHVPESLKTGHQAGARSAAPASCKLAGGLLVLPAPRHLHLRLSSTCQSLIKLQHVDGHPVHLACIVEGCAHSLRMYYAPNDSWC